MGKKATFYLIDLLIALLTIALALFSAVGWMAGQTDPCRWGFPALAGLALPLLLAADIVLLLYWLFKRKWWAIVPVTALLLNTGFLTAYFQFHSSDTPARPYDLKIATYNIHGFRQADFKTTVENIAATLRQQQADVICLQEFMLNKYYGLDSIRRAFEWLPYYYVPVKGTDIGGAVIFSRYPITDSGHIDFSDTDNSAVWADIEVQGHKIRVFNNHFQTTEISRSRSEMADLRNFDPLEGEGKKEKAAKTILKRLESNFCKRATQVEQVRAMVDATPYPVIVCGDFNDTPASYTYHRMKEGLSDGFKACGTGYGYTFRGFFHLLRIDYIFYGAAMEGVNYYSPSEPWSDHNPVLAEIKFTPVPTESKN